MKKHVLLMIVVVLSVAFIGCDLLDDDDDKVSGDGGVIGQILVLPGGTVVDWDMAGGAGDVYVAKSESEIFAGPIRIGVDGVFAGAEIGPIPAGSLDLLVDVMPSGLSVDNTDAKVFRFDELIVTTAGGVSPNGDIARENEEGDRWVEWFFVDSAVRITGTRTETYDGTTFTFDYDLPLQSGWNRAVFTFVDFETPITVRRGDEPAGVRWEFWPHDEDE